ncbi:hypothetical protein [Bradyrhizobium sp. Leo121]|uniref:hypothetical protein n=1 Tax=Bradyrhizobium sp. Leo121 TaxID=1571195 RepID=UPI0010294D04|nr:hypothetical protein [Bradyrhizobium sp. Leo121]RZN21940.1 hypothetical protein CWO90_32515 [Bradyrhizobium sp. Leo121]
MLAIACCLFIFMVQSVLFSFGYRLTADDVEAHYFALDTVQAFLDYTGRMAVASGRVGHYVAVPVNMAGAFASDYLAARLFFSIVFFGSFVAFAVLLGRLMRAPRLIAPLSLAYLICCPLLFSHTPPNAYPLQVTLPFLVILLCRIFLIGREYEKAVGVVRLVLMVAITVGSEYTLLFTAGVLIVEHSIRNADNMRGMLRSKLLWADFATMAVALIPYTFRFAAPSVYGGNQPDGISDIHAVLSILWLHTWNGTIFAHLGVRAILESWKVLVAASGLAFVAALGAFLLPLGTRPRVRLVSIVCLALLAAWLCVMLPPSTNKRLHDWCSISNECTYTTSRLAYYFVIPAVFLPIIVYFDKSALALLTAALVFFGFSHNWTLSAMMRSYVHPYKEAIYSACAIDPAKALAALDPENHISMHPWMDRSAYWSRLAIYERYRQGC